MYQIAPPSKINPVVPMGPCGYSGVGCAGMGGLTMDGSGLFGTGIFGTGVSVTDLSLWGIGEWVAVALGVFVVGSVFGSTKRAASKVGRKVRYIKGAGQRRRSAKAAKLRAEAERIEAAA